LEEKEQRGEDKVEETRRGNENFKKCGKREGGVNEK